MYDSIDRNLLRTDLTRLEGTDENGMNITGAGDLHKIVVLNPKGGCGKTTLATNLVSCYAQRGLSPILADCDPQGFCTRWLENRPRNRPPIRGVVADGDAVDLSGLERSVAGPDPTPAVFDLPAAVPYERLHHYSYWADSLLIPVMPSPVDVFSATRLIAELLLDVQLDRRLGKLAIVANRVRCNTRGYRMLLRFLNSLKIPLIATLRDSQNFVYASAHGLGVCELPAYRAGTDAASLDLIMAWLGRLGLRGRGRAPEREALIAQAAYRLAERRGFHGGNPESDWLEAEREVDAFTEHPHHRRRETLS